MNGLPLGVLPRLPAAPILELVSEYPTGRTGLGDQIAAELNKPARILVRFEPFADRASGPLADAALQSLGVERVESTIDLVPGLAILKVDPDRAARPSPDQAPRPECRPGRRDRRAGDRL